MFLEGVLHDVQPNPRDGIVGANCHRTKTMCSGMGSLSRCHLVARELDDFIVVPLCLIQIPEVVQLLLGRKVFSFREELPTSKRLGVAIVHLLVGKSDIGHLRSIIERRRG